MKKFMLFLILLAAAAYLALLGYRTWRGRAAAPKAVLPASVETVPCLCYFPSQQGLELCEETTTRPKTDDPNLRLRGTIEALHQKPSSQCSMPMFPEDTSPRAVFLTADGTAYLDYPAAVFERPMGMREEFLFVRALARTLLRNCPDVSAFVILVEGSPRSRIALHMPAHGRYILPRVPARR